jgi:hypothetical protein
MFRDAKIRCLALYAISRKPIYALFFISTIVTVVFKFAQLELCNNNDGKNPSDLSTGKHTPIGMVFLILSWILVIPVIRDFAQIELFGKVIISKTDTNSGIAMIIFLIYSVFSVMLDIVLISIYLGTCGTKGIFRVNPILVISSFGTVILLVVFCLYLIDYLIKKIPTIVTSYNDKLSEIDKVTPV